ncbi:MAG: hypothetical protein IT210_15625 [Armatimonadetes bacterium]|nr:hypothetical protein [Armatimonadota bacterium]
MTDPHFQPDIQAPKSGPEQRPAPQRPGMTWRVAGLACLLSALNAYWIVKTEVVWAFIHATVLSIFFNVLFCLFIVVLLNRLLTRFLPRQALQPGEMVALYVLLCASTAVFGHDFLQVLANLLVYPYWKAGSEGNWGQPVTQRLPRWLVVTDKSVLEGFWLGSSSAYSPEVLKAWAVPLLAWMGFMLVLIWTMLCAVSLLRRRWTEHERLSFPLVQIPLELLVHHDRLLKSRMFWIAFVLAGGLDLWNALATVYPSFPSVRLKLDLAPLFAERPWNAMGWTPLALYPFAVGLAYFMPLDLAFSAWIFFWIWKAQTVIRSLMGMEALTGAYLGDQSTGAWIGFGLLSLWGTRRYMASAFRQAFFERGSGDDSGEPMRYRTAFLGLAAGFIALTVFGQLMGLSLWVSLAFFALFFVFCAAATRMRAEFGPITHDLYFSGPERVMTVLTGSGPYSPQNLVALSQFHWFTRDFRSSPMPHQLEGFKLGREAGLRLRPFILPIMAISAFAFVAWFWCYLHVMYERGAIIRVAWPGSGWTSLAAESYRRLDQWLGSAGKGPDFSVWQHFFGGLGATALLLWLRQRFLWFPFHPVGYALAGSWTMSWLWFSILTGWAVKSLLLRYGGVRAYRLATHFFIGLVLGEFVLGGSLSLWNALTDQITFGFFP